MAILGKDILQAKRLLESGKLVAIPTETVYGLAGNALDPQAVTQIFEVKKRPVFDPLIVHTHSMDEVTKYCQHIPGIVYELSEKFWPGPLTFLLDRKSTIPDLVTAGLETVALRCPAHPLTFRLLQELTFPLAAPSANPFGYVSPTNAQHVNDQLGNDLEYILDGGECLVGVESTILGFENEHPIIYRLGGLPVEELEKILGKLELRISSSNPNAPGQLDRHYSPRKKIIIGKIDELIKEYPAAGILSFSNDYHHPVQYVLSRDGDLGEAARNFFGALRYLDQQPIEIILADFVPDTGLGKAINDRLRRASFQ